MPAGSISANGSRIARWTIGTLALLLLVYAVVRAYTVSFSYDETFTFMEHVRKGVFYQRAFDQMGGNHHLLNVWGMWVCMKLFGTSELALRLPNLLAYVGYLYACARIALRARHAVLAIALFVLLNIHPYLIDFFSLARGYGLANGFLMMSLWQAVRYFDEGVQRSRLAWAMGFAALAAMSHVIMINYLLAFGLAMMMVIAFRAYRQGLKAWRGHLFVVFGIGALGLVLILPNALGLFHGGSLNFGCDGFWGCTLRTLMEKMLYHVWYDHEPLAIVSWTLLLIGAWCATTLAVSWRKERWRDQMPLLFGLLVLGLCVLSFIAQQVLFGVPLPQTRTALFLVPLTAFVLVSACLGWRGSTWLSNGVAVLFCIPLPYHQARAFDLTRSEEWLSSGEVRKALEIIATDHLPLTDIRPVVKISSGFECSGSLAYYIHTRNWRWLTNTDRVGQDSFPRSDYYLVEWDAHDFVDHANCTELFHSNTTGLSLFRDDRVRALGTDVLHHGQIPGADHADPLMRSMEWTVPPEWTPGPVLISGSVRALERRDTNWIGLTLELLRDNVVIESDGLPSHRQVVHYGEWGTTSVEFIPRTTLRPGDLVRFTVRPCFVDLAIDLGDADLWVLR
ncbi:MAG: hypothetical protein IPI81_11950 [Flavobacteriales bacterium]|nr:hypothetical protein [Flavobacteriales bacterium]MCC6939116.1 hypothetical protein [Flavobacteriales bacterium]